MAFLDRIRITRDILGGEQNEAAFGACGCRIGDGALVPGERTNYRNDDESIHPNDRPGSFGGTIRFPELDTSATGSWFPGTAKRSQHRSRTTRRIEQWTGSAWGTVERRRSVESTADPERGRRRDSI